MTTPLATVFGAQGFIGSHLAAHLRRHGWACQEAEREPRWLLQRELGTVFFCAGLTSDYAQRPHDTVAAHVSVLNELLCSARFERLVYLSSTRLYDTLPGYPADEDGQLALNPAQPRHLYDLSKALGESLCRHASNGRAHIARLSCVYGSATAGGGFLDDLLRRTQAAAPGARLEIDTSANQVRDYIHIDDVVEALRLIASHATQAAYNVASGANISNAALFARLGELARCELHATHRQRLPNPAALSIARMQREFGWQPVALLDKLAELVKVAEPC